jgi:hypothetical protein
LTEDPWKNLRAIDGDAAPKVSLPADATVTWDVFVNQFAPR